MNGRDDISEYFFNEHRKLVVKLLLRAVYRKVAKDKLLDKSDIPFLLEEAVRVQREHEKGKS